MNEKLTYCAHVVELVKSHMAEQKSIRIEILIVILILIEVSCVQKHKVSSRLIVKKFNIFLFSNDRNKLCSAHCIPIMPTVLYRDGQPFLVCVAKIG